MKNLFFLDVDTQRDFMTKSGSLFVPGAERIIPKLRRLFDFARRNDITIVSTMDTHAPDDPEFLEFPVHCVQGTDGHRKLEDTLLPHPMLFTQKPVDRNLADVVRKNRQIIVEKSDLDVFHNPVMERLLRVLPPRAIVFGVATEYCVKYACLGLKKCGVQTAVVSDAVRALSPKGEREAIYEMQNAGVDFITLETLESLTRS